MRVSASASPNPNPDPEPSPNQVTVRGFFFPGFDGLKGSARCMFGGQMTIPSMLEAKNGIIVCASPLRASSAFASSAGGVGYEDVAFSVALNTVRIHPEPNPNLNLYQDPDLSPNPNPSPKPSPNPNPNPNPSPSPSPNPGRLCW